MVSTLKPKYWTLVSIHKPLGIAILVLVVLRLAVRFRRGAPPLPTDLPRWQALAAKASHVMLYGLMLAMPLIGWAMLSAGGYPVVLGGPVRFAAHRAPRRPACTPCCGRPTPGLALLLFATVADAPRRRPVPRPRAQGRRLLQHGVHRAGETGACG